MPASGENTASKHPWAIQGWVVFLAGFVLTLWKAPYIGRYFTSLDLGYQLALSRQIAQGYFPFVDHVFHYGPFAALASAIGIKVSNSLLSEAVICSLGYSTSFVLMSKVARDKISVLAGYLVPLVALLLLARYYKWYYWLFQALALFCAHKYLLSERRHRWVLLAGLATGVGGLFRFDIGVLLAVFFTVLVFANNIVTDRAYRKALREFSVFAGTASVPFAAWLLVLVLKGGPENVYIYIDTMLFGSSGYLKYWSLPFPKLITFEDPFSRASIRNSIHALALLLVPLTYVISLAAGAWYGYMRPRQDGVHKGMHEGIPKSIMDARFMAFTAILGIGVFPQALHRVSIFHLLQVIPPFLFTLPILALWLKRKMPETPRAKWSAYALVVICAMFVLFFHRFSGGSPFLHNGMGNIKALYTMEMDESKVPGAGILRAIRENTSPSDRILAVPTIPSVYYFSDRKMSGYVHYYGIGFFDNDFWRARNMEKVLAEPPVVVVECYTEETELFTAKVFRRSQPELSRFIEENYNTVLFEGPICRVLKRD